MSPSLIKSTFKHLAFRDDSDKPTHLRSLNRIFAVRMKNPCIDYYPKSTTKNLIIFRECTSWYAADLNLRSAHTPKCFIFFVHVTVQVFQDIFNILGNVRQCVTRASNLRMEQTLPVCYAIYSRERSLLMYQNVSE